MNQDGALQQIEAFGKHYQYDTGYMKEMLGISALAYEKFSQASELSRYLEFLDPHTHWLVKLTAMQVEDCGQCLQLTVRMALEEGMDSEFVSNVLYQPQALSELQQDTRLFVEKTAINASCPEPLMLRMRANYEQGAIMEIGLAIASVKLYPTLKRALGYAESCSLINLEIQ